VALFVAKNRNAIGYVPVYLAEGKKGIRIIKVLKEVK